MADRLGWVRSTGPAGLPPMAVQKQVERGSRQATASSVVTSRLALYSGSK